MAPRRSLIERLRAALAGVPRVVEKKMFGGTAFMVNGKMCITARADRLMCRIDPALHDAMTKRKGVRTVRMRGHAYRGFVHVDASAAPTKRALEFWVRTCLAFNPSARSSRRS